MTRKRLLEAAAIAALCSTAALASAPYQFAKPAAKKALRAGPKTAPQGYKLETFEIPGATFLLATDINARGVVSGIYTTDENRYHTFLYADGKLTTIHRPGFDHTLVGAINNEGNLLYGNWGSTTSQEAGFYNTKTNVWTALPTPPVSGKPIHLGQRFADSGRAVGASCEGTIDITFNCIGWEWDGTSYTIIELPDAGPLGTQPNAINNRGDKVIMVGDPDQAMYRAYLVDANGVQRLQVPGSIKEGAYNINNEGAIVMNAEIDPNDWFKPVLWRAGQFALLPEHPQAQQTVYFGINERGDMAGGWWEFKDGAPLFHGLVAWKK